MIRFNLILCSVILLTITSCNKELKTVTLKYELRKDTYPISNSGNSHIDTVYSSIYIPVTIDGQEFKLKFDTGANCTVLEYGNAIKKELKFKKLNGIISDIHTLEVQRTKDTLYFSNKDLSIGGLCWQSNPIFLNGYKHLYVTSDEGTDGYLGMDIINTKNWLFNLKEQTVTIYDEEINEQTIESPLVLSMDMNLKDSVTNVNLTINDSLSVPFLFDTGFTSFPVLTEEKSGKKYSLNHIISISDSLANAIKPISTIGDIALMINKLTINNFELDSLCIFITKKFSTHLGTKHKDLNFISGGFLHNFHYALFDYKNKRLRFYGYSPKNESIRRYIKEVIKNN